MVNNKFVGATSLGASDFHSRLIADTASQRKLKARDALTVPFRFLCDYDDQSYQHMYFIARRLEILKDEIALFREYSQQVTEHSKGEKLSGLGSCSVPMKKSQNLGKGKNPQTWMT
jgi:hypothetical protein